MEDNLEGLLIKDMESAYGEGEKTIGGQEARDAAMLQAAHKYFPPGMKADEAFKILRRLKAHGFETSEYRHEGARHWPDGEFKPYLDEQTKRNLQRQYPKGVGHFIAQKQYGKQMLIFPKYIAISFRFIDGSEVITDVKGNIWTVAP